MLRWGARERAAVLRAIGLVAGLCVGLVPAQADVFDPAYYRSNALLSLYLAAYDPGAFALPAPRAAEPFRAELEPAHNAFLDAKWDGVKKGLRRESIVIKNCRDDAAACPAVATKFLAIVERAHSRSGWSRIAEVNRSVNLSVKAVSDQEQYGRRDLWATPLMTLSSSAGDCEDYAIAKYAALRELGYADDDLRLVIVKDTAAAEDHAVLAVRHDGRWLVLDNKTLEIRDDDAIAAFNPLFMIGSGGVHKIARLTPKSDRSPWTDASTRLAPIDILAGWPFTPATM